MKTERQCLFPERVIVVYFKIISWEKSRRHQHPLAWWLWLLDVMSGNQLMYLPLLFLLNTELTSDLKLVLTCLSPMKWKNFKEPPQMKWHTSRVWICCFPVFLSGCERKLYITPIQKSTKAFKQEWQSSMSNVGAHAGTRMTRCLFHSQNSNHLCNVWGPTLWPWAQPQNTVTQTQPVLINSNNTQ